MIELFLRSQYDSKAISEQICVNGKGEENSPPTLKSCVRHSNLSVPVHSCDQKGLS